MTTVPLNLAFTVIPRYWPKLRWLYYKGDYEVGFEDNILGSCSSLWKEINRHLFRLSISES